MIRAATLPLTVGCIGCSVELQGNRLPSAPNPTSACPLSAGTPDRSFCGKFASKKKRARSFERALNSR